MNKLLAEHRHELDSLCEKFEVRQLELFGSAAQGNFNPATSDLDFLVVFQRNSKADAADRFLGLLADLEKLFARKVDLVDVLAHRNPYFMAQALKHREVIYAA